jgi:hypothetical protein
MKVTITMTNVTARVIMINNKEFYVELVNYSETKKAKELSKMPSPFRIDFNRRYGVRNTAVTLLRIAKDNDIGYDEFVIACIKAFRM